MNSFILDTLSNTQRILKMAVDGLTQEELAYQPDKESNSIGFILWHQIRAEDVMIQGMILQKPELWETESWCTKLGFPEGTAEDGGGYTAEQVALFRVPELKLLMDYGDAVRAQTLAFIHDLTPEKLDEVVKSPVFEMTVGKTLSLLVCELALHTGQVSYLRGLQRGINK